MLDNSNGLLCLENESVGEQWVGLAKIRKIRYSESVKKAAISVTEASRNFAECVNRARYQNTSFLLLKNGKPVARLVPENEKVCTGQDLVEALEQTSLSAEEARAWHKDLTAARKKLNQPDDKWR